jgi:hypothetical protein
MVTKISNNEHILGTDNNRKNGQTCNMCRHDRNHSTENVGLIITTHKYGGNYADTRVNVTFNIP